MEKTTLSAIPIAGGARTRDNRMLDRIFKDPTAPDTFRQAAGSRDGAMSALVGIAARNSIDTGKPVRIADLTDIPVQAIKPR